MLLPASPDEVRGEVDTLLADLVVRLKQLLFNSLLSAYYVGFIPMLFADVSLLCPTVWGGGGGGGCKWMMQSRMWGGEEGEGVSRWICGEGKRGRM